MSMSKEEQREYLRRVLKPSYMPHPALPWRKPYREADEDDD